MNKYTVLILGARSEIGMAIAHKFASMGHPIQLAARRVYTLDRDKSDLELRYGVKVTLNELDIIKIEKHAYFVDSLSHLPDIAICVVGYMGNQSESERDNQAASLVMRTNFEGPASIMAELANRFELRGSGTLIGISSVAGERGRISNYIYGSSKAGFTTFLSGLRNRLSSKGVHVITVLPGFVATRMTESMYLPSILTAQCNEVASAIYNAVNKKKNIIYVRKVWKFIMMFIKIMPENLFKKMKL